MHANCTVKKYNLNFYMYVFTYFCKLLALIISNSLTLNIQWPMLLENNA
jgi:hypothetical protein